MIVGFIVVGLALFVEFTFGPPFWVHMSSLGPARAHPRDRSSPPPEGPDDRPAIQAPGGRGPDRRDVSAVAPGQGAPDAAGDRSGGWRRLIVLAIAALIAFVILVGLGVWQLERLAWKEALIARVEAGLASRPGCRARPGCVGLARSERRSSTSRSTLRGRLRSYEGDPCRPHADRPEGARSAVSAIRCSRRFGRTQGWWVYVNRGFVPRENEDPATRKAGQIEGEMTVVGLLRAVGSRSWFTPADDSRRATNGSRATPLCSPPRQVCRRDDGRALSHRRPLRPGSSGRPAAGRRDLVSFPNNHLQYALTWFGLAAVLLGVFAAFVMRRSKEGSP